MAPSPNSPQKDECNDSREEVIIPSPTPSPPRSELSQSKIRTGKTVIVEGNIGSGKSTFLNYFRRYKNVEVLKEPVDEWKDVAGYNALDLMYKDAMRWSAAFECMVTLSMIKHHQTSKKPNTLKMLERSIYSTRHCFMENLRENNLIPSVDYSILKEYHKWIDLHEDIHVDLIVYLRASPETCSQRMKKRNRSEEAGVPLEYLQALHRLHDDWLLHGKRGKLPAPVLVLDANKDLPDLQEDIASYSHDILGGLTSPSDTYLE